MEKIKFLTDSACDIPKEYEEEYGISIMSVPITVDQETYLERESFTNQEFYEILLSRKDIPVTAHVTYHAFYEKYKEIYHLGYTDIIHVCISSTGSNTINAAEMAKNMLYEGHPEIAEKMKIHIIDSLNYSGMYGMPIMEAAQMAKDGKSVKEILEYLDDWFACGEVHLAVYSLEHAKKSGRINCAAAFVGDVLGLRPIISIIDGQTKIEQKVRGDKGVVSALVKYVKPRIVDKAPYCVVRGCLDEPAEELVKLATKEFGYPPKYVLYAGASIAINSGPKIVALCTKGKKRR